MSFCQGKAARVWLSDDVVSRAPAVTAETGGWCRPRNSGRPPLSPLHSPSLKSTGCGVDAEDSFLTSRTLLRAHMPREKKESDADTTPSHRRESRQLNAPVLWLKPQQILSTYLSRVPMIAQPTPSRRSET